MIEVTNIVKTYGKTAAVNGISFTVKAGECFALLGPNGAGKSTSINMLSALLLPDSGNIILDGMDIIKSRTEIKKVLGIVPQEIALYDNLTAWENMLFWGNIYGITGKNLHTRANDLLIWVGLEDRKKERVKTYSGGMKRRINLVCSLLHSPKILLLDEPTVGVDPQSRNLIFELVEQLNKEGMTIIYTTHYMEEAERLCNRIAIMDNGKIIAQGKLDDLRLKSGVNDEVIIKCSHTPDEKILAGKLKVQFVVTEKTIQILADDASKNLTAFVAAIAEVGCEITNVEVKKANLETIFLKMTGKQLRD